MKKFKYLFIIFLILNAILVLNLYQAKSDGNNFGTEGVEKSDNDEFVVNAISNGDFTSLFVDRRGDQFKLVLFYPKEYCSICVDLDLPFLKRIAATNPKSLVVVNSGLEYNLRSIIDPLEKSVGQVSIEGLNIDESLVEEIADPVMVMVHRTGTPIFTYVSKMGDIESATEFYERAGILLSLN